MISGPSLLQAIEMRCAGHVASAIRDVCAISQQQADDICRDIPLGWDDAGCFARPRARALAPVPA